MEELQKQWNLYDSIGTISLQGIRENLFYQKHPQYAFYVAVAKKIPLERIEEILTLYDSTQIDSFFNDITFYTALTYTSDDCFSYFFTKFIDKINREMLLTRLHSHPYYENVEKKLKILS